MQISSDRHVLWHVRAVGCPWRLSGPTQVAVALKKIRSSSVLVQRFSNFVRPGRVFDIIPSTRVVLGKDLWQCLSGCAATGLPSAKPHSAKAKALWTTFQGALSLTHNHWTRLCSNSSSLVH
jgi:hypothetical protein